MITQTGMSALDGRFPLATSARKMIPIVFCASLVPCESENSEAEASWPSRNPRVTTPGAWRPTIRYAARIDSPAASMASTGATIAGTATFSTRPLQLTSPPAASVAPTIPPISACDDDEGSPNHQVTRFQAIAPTRPAKTVSSVTEFASTMPVAIVAATASERKAPTKFRLEAISTAIRGDIARVETEVAIEFAVSWNPLVKSKAIAVATTIQSTASECTGLPVLDDDALERVHRGLGRVDRVLEPLEDVLPADHHHRVDPALEQRRDGFAQDPVALVLEPVDLDRVVVHVLQGPQARHRVVDLARRVAQHARHALRLLHRRLDPVEPEEVRDLLDVVDDVVQRRGELDDVLAVEGRDEGLVEPLDDVVGDAVALLLADDHVPHHLPMVRPLLEHGLEKLGRAHAVAAGLLEEVEELALARGEQPTQPAHGGPVYVNELLRAHACGWRERQLRAEALELLGRDPVRVLGRREGPRADLVGVGLHAAQHLGLDMREALGELGL